MSYQYVGVLDVHRLDYSTSRHTIVPPGFFENINQSKLSMINIILSLSRLREKISGILS